MELEAKRKRDVQATGKGVWKMSSLRTSFPWQLKERGTAGEEEEGKERRKEGGREKGEREPEKRERGKRGWREALIFPFINLEQNTWSNLLIEKERR